MATGSRTLWKGAITFGLVHIPVGLHTAAIVVIGAEIPPASRRCRGCPPCAAGPNSENVEVRKPPRIGRAPRRALRPGRQSGPARRQVEAVQKPQIRTLGVPASALLNV